MHKPRKSQITSRSHVSIGKNSMSGEVDEDAERRDDEKERTAEGAMGVGPFDTQDQHRGADHDEGEQGANVDHLFQGADRREGGDHAHDAARHHRGNVWRAESLMHGARRSTVA